MVLQSCRTGSALIGTLVAAMGLVTLYVVKMLRGETADKVGAAPGGNLAVDHQNP
jgi:hypothetical protein